jgi:hypothetical protein
MVLALERHRERSLKEGFGVKKELVLSIFIFIVFVVNPATSDALQYQFSGSDTTYITSATMDVTVSGNQLTIILNNTSPRRTTGIEPSHLNSPGINGFGFNLGSLATANVTAWSLTAYQYPLSSTSSVIGGSSTGASSAWFYGSIPSFKSLSFIFTPISMPWGDLYSPATGSYLPGPYYTAATLHISFDQAISEFKDPLIRFENVGEGGNGTLKLIGAPETPVPEPGTVLLLGLGLIGIGIIMRELF